MNAQIEIAWQNHLNVVDEMFDYSGEEIVIAVELTDKNLGDFNDSYLESLRRAGL